MHLFEISAPGMAPVSVFARSFDEAVNVFITARILGGDSGLPDLDVRRRSEQWPGQNIEHYQEAIAFGMAGIGRYDEAQGWTILGRLPEGDE